MTNKIPSVRVAGGRFVDADGKPLMLRGCSTAALNFVPIQGWSPDDPWGNQTGGSKVPQWDLMRTLWNMNTVRIPVNQATWLGMEVVDYTGKTRQADPGRLAKPALIAAVKEATAQGHVVVIDLHWSAPGNSAPLEQNMFADDPGSVIFWRSIAETFKSYPNVMFELFNEPVPYRVPRGRNPWEIYRHGGPMTGYVTAEPGVWYREQPWRAAGFQQMLDAIRGTGATNVCLIAGDNWAGDLRQWLEYKVDDPLGQIAATWHVYPAFGAEFGTKEHLEISNHGSWADADRIIAAGYPVAVTEIGDQCTPGTPGSPFADRHLGNLRKRRTGTMGVWGWTWNVWPNETKHVLIRDGEGTPTDGWGRVYYEWCRSVQT